MDKNLLDFLRIMENFVEGKAIANDFTKQFFTLHQKDYKFSSDEVANIIDQMFYYAEDYCEYPELRDENDLDEKQLLNKTQLLLNKLKNL